MVKWIAAADVLDPRCEMLAGSGHRSAVMFNWSPGPWCRGLVCEANTGFVWAQTDRGSARAPPYLGHMVLEATGVPL